MRDMKRKIILLRLVFKGIISLEYWWNYDCDDKHIIIMGDGIDDPEQNHVLNYHSQLKLAGEDIYRIEDTDNWLVGKWIDDPIAGSVYQYDYLTCKFNLVMNNAVSD